MHTPQHRQKQAVEGTSISPSSEIQTSTSIGLCCHERTNTHSKTHQGYHAATDDLQTASTITGTSPHRKHTTTYTNTLCRWIFLRLPRYTSRTTYSRMGTPFARPALDVLWRSHHRSQSPSVGGSNTTLQQHRWTYSNGVCPYVGLLPHQSEQHHNRLWQHIRSQLHTRNLGHTRKSTARPNSSTLATSLPNKILCLLPLRGSSHQLTRLVVHQQWSSRYGSQKRGHRAKQLTRLDAHRSPKHTHTTTITAHCLAAAITTLPGGHSTVHTYKQAKPTKHTLQQTSTPTAGQQTSNTQTTPRTFSQHERNTTRTRCIQQSQNVQAISSTMGSKTTSTLDPGPLHTVGWSYATTRHRSLLSTPQETWCQHTRQNPHRTQPFRPWRNNTVCGTSWQRTLRTTSKLTATLTTSTRHCVGIRPSTRWKGGHPRTPQNERQQRWHRYHHSRLHALVRTDISTSNSTHYHTTLEHWTTYLGQINTWSDWRAALQKQRVSAGPFQLQMYTAHQCHLTSPSQSGRWQNTTPCRTKTVTTKWAVWIPQIPIHNWTNYAGPKHCRTTTGLPHGLPPTPPVGGYSESIPSSTTRTGMAAFCKIGFSSTSSSATTWTPRFSPICHSNKSRQRQNLHQ